MFFIDFANGHSFSCGYAKVLEAFTIVTEKKVSMTCIPVQNEIESNVTIRKIYEAVIDQVRKQHVDWRDIGDKNTYISFMACVYLQ